MEKLPHMSLKIIKFPCKGLQVCGVTQIRNAALEGKIYPRLYYLPAGFFPFSSKSLS